MDRAIVRDILLDNKYISEVELDENEVFQGKRYNFIVRNKLDVLDKFITIIITISILKNLFIIILPS